LKHEIGERRVDVVALIEICVAAGADLVHVRRGSQPEPPGLTMAWSRQGKPETLGLREIP
jgi:hypothetical protein